MRSVRPAIGRLTVPMLYLLALGLAACKSRDQTIAPLSADRGVGVGVICGRVHGPRGPIANATVFLRPAREAWLPGEVLVDGFARARSSDSGEFRVVAPPGSYYMHTNLAFVEPRYLPHAPIEVVVREQQIIRQDMALTEGLTISGRLFGADGEPVTTRPLIRAYASIPVPSHGTWLMFHVRCVVEPNGDFCLGGFPPGLYELKVEVAGTLTSLRFRSATALATAGDVNVRIVLPFGDSASDGGGE